MKGTIKQFGGTGVINELTGNVIACGRTGIDPGAGKCAGYTDRV
jgi:hypothetical protein